MNTYPIRPLLTAAAATALTVPVLALAPPAVAQTADPISGACAAEQGVTLVVNVGPEGGDVVRCAPGDPTDGIQALRAAGFDVQTNTSSFGEFVCRVDTVGDCAAAFTGDYWAFFTAGSTAAWELSALGASDVDPEPGAVHGWNFGAGVAPTTAPPVSPAPESPGTGTADTAAAAAAATYLAGELDDGVIPGFEGRADYAVTSDAALGLLAAGTQDAALDTVLDRLEEDAALFARGQENAADGERPDAVYTGQTAKLGLLASLTGADPRAFGGLDLVSDLQRTEQDGRYTDISDLGDVSNVFTQSLGLLSLVAAEAAPTGAAVQVLAAAQCPDGGFPVSFVETPAACSSDPDATGLALQALAALDQTPAAASAVDYLRSVQRADGAFTSSTPGAVGGNVNSTGYAAMGLAAAGQDVTGAVTWLASTALDDGGLPVTESGEGGSDVFATAQALPALTARGFLATERDVLRGEVVVPTTSAVPTTSEAPTTSAAPTTSEAPTSTVAPSSSATPTVGAGGTARPATTSAPLPTSTVRGDAGTPTTPVAAGTGAPGDGELASTGGGVLAPLVLGGVLLAAGGGTVLATRRRGDQR